MAGIGAGPTGLEPATSGVTDQRSHQLNYGPSSGPEGSRTPDLLNAIQALSQLSYGPSSEESVSENAQKLD